MNPAHILWMWLLRWLAPLLVTAPEIRVRLRGKYNYIMIDVGGEAAEGEDVAASGRDSTAVTVFTRRWMGHGSLWEVRCRRLFTGEKPESVALRVVVSSIGAVLEETLCSGFSAARRRPSDIGSSCECLACYLGMAGGVFDTAVVVREWI